MILGHRRNDETGLLPQLPEIGLHSLGRGSRLVGVDEVVTMSPGMCLDKLDDAPDAFPVPPEEQSQSCLAGLIPKSHGVGRSTLLPLVVVGI